MSNKSSAKKTYFAKFTSLPFKYDCVNAVNSVMAKKHFEQYRDDVVIIEPNEKVISFSDYHSRTFEKIDITQEQYKQWDEANGTAFNGGRGSHELVRQDYLGSLRSLYSLFPGADKGNLFQTNKVFTFAVKSTKKLAEYLFVHSMIGSGLTQEQIEKQIMSTTHFPLFIFTTKQLKQKKVFLEIEDKE